MCLLSSSTTFVLVKQGLVIQKENIVVDLWLCFQHEITFLYGLQICKSHKLLNHVGNMEQHSPLENTARSMVFGNYTIFCLPVHGHIYGDEILWWLTCCILGLSILHYFSIYTVFANIISHLTNQCSVRSFLLELCKTKYRTTVTLIRSEQLHPMTTG